MGQYRSVPDKKKRSESGETNRLAFAASGMCGWRIYMEDAHIAKPSFAQNYGLFAVFDGHGGGEVARFTEKHFPQQLLNNQNFAKKRYELALTETFLKMDRLLKTPEAEKQLKLIKKELLEQSTMDQGEDRSYAGCTAVVCLITDTQVYVASAGDSRCILGLVGGKAQDMTKDHKPEDETELARIKKAGGDVIQGRVNGNLNLSRAIGDLQYKCDPKLKEDEQLIISKPDIMRRALNGIDYIVLGCDGIFEIKTNQEIIDMVISRSSKKNLKQTCEEIIDALIAPSTQSKNRQNTFFGITVMDSDQFGLDNMTLLIVKLKN